MNNGANSDRSILTLDLTLEDPTLLTQLEGEPNSSTSYGFIPGSVLRGALLALYLASRETPIAAQDVLDDPVASLLFFSAHVRFLNGYLRWTNGDVTTRALPAPLSWHQDKIAARIAAHGKPVAVSDFVHTNKEDNGQQWKRLNGDGDTFCAGNFRNELALLSPKRQIAIHTQRDRKAGRAVRGSGDVYRYEALRAWQVFRSHVLGDWERARSDNTNYSAETIESAQKALTTILASGYASIGGARTAGYGRVKLAQVDDALEEGSAEDWSEARSFTSSSEGIEASWVLTFLSDALVTDAQGNCCASTDALRQTLAAQLGVAAEMIAPTPEYMRGRLLGGFNRTWGLPLPQSEAVQMGSVWRLPARSLTSAQVNQLTWEGIGLRRNEGFGRIAINWHGEVEQMIPEKEFATKPAPVVLTDPASTALAQVLCNRLLRQKLDEAVMAKANSLSQRIHRPKVSQLTRLQAIVRDELNKLPTLPSQDELNDKADLKTALRYHVRSRIRLNPYLRSLNQRQQTRDQFGRGSFEGSQPLLVWLRAYINDPRDIMNTLGLTESELPKIGGVTARWHFMLCYEYALRLIHDTLALAAKHKRKEGGDR